MLFCPQLPGLRSPWAPSITLSCDLQRGDGPAQQRQGSIVRSLLLEHPQLGVTGVRLDYRQQARRVGFVGVVMTLVPFLPSFVLPRCSWA